MSDDFKQKDPGPDEAIRKEKDGDTEGHRKFADDGEGGPGPEGQKRMQSLTDDDGDVEGHRK